MKRILLTFAAFGCLASLVFAGPGWKRINYTRSTIFTGIVTYDGQPAAEGDMIGIFVGGECRMMATVFTREGVSYVSAVIHGEIKENVQVKAWKSESDAIIDLDSTFETKPDEELMGVNLNFKSGSETTNGTEVAAEELDVTPTITESTVSIKAHKAIKAVTVFDNIGKKIAVVKGNGESEDLLLGQPKGIYFIAVELENGTVSTKKVVKY